MTIKTWSAVSAATGQALSKLLAALTLFGALSWTAAQTASVMVTVEAFFLIPLAIIGSQVAVSNRAAPEIAPAPAAGD